MKSIKIILVLLLIAVVFVTVVEFFVLEKKVEKSPFVQIGETRINVEIADTDALRERGLSGRESLGENDGVLFIFPSMGIHGFWMKDMRFPIDIVWISNGKIIGIEKDIDSQVGAQISELRIYYPPEPVDKVLEIAAGKSDNLGIKTGDKVEFGL